MEIALYPKTVVDAGGQLHGDRKKEIRVATDPDTAIAVFNDLEPGVYIVCFRAFGFLGSASVNAGEIVIEPGVILKKNLRWPSGGLTYGDNCKL